MLTVAGGGIGAARNPKGREIGIGRNIAPAKPAAAIRCMSTSPVRSARRPCISTRSRSCRSATLLATNGFTHVQAFEIARRTRGHLGRAISSRISRCAKSPPSCAARRRAGAEGFFAGRPSAARLQTISTRSTPRPARVTLHGGLASTRPCSFFDPHPRTDELDHRAHHSDHDTARARLTLLLFSLSPQAGRESG